MRRRAAGWGLPRPRPWRSCRSWRSRPRQAAQAQAMQAAQAQAQAIAMHAHYGGHATHAMYAAQLQGAAMHAALVPTMLPHGHPAAMHAAAHVDPRAAAAMAAAAAAAHAHGHPGYAPPFVERQ